MPPSISPLERELLFPFIRVVIALALLFFLASFLPISGTIPSSAPSPSHEFIPNHPPAFPAPLFSTFPYNRTGYQEKHLTTTKASTTSSTTSTSLPPDNSQNDSSADAGPPPTGIVLDSLFSCQGCLQDVDTNFTVSRGSPNFTLNLTNYGPGNASFISYDGNCSKNGNPNPHAMLVAPDPDDRGQTPNLADFVIGINTDGFVDESQQAFSMQEGDAQTIQVMNLPAARGIWYACTVEVYGIPQFETSFAQQQDFNVSFLREWKQS